MTQLKSLAHPEWPYTGTPWEWRGFGKKADNREWVVTGIVDGLESGAADRYTVYQKQNFGPELP